MLSIGRTLFVCLVAHLCCGQNALDKDGNILRLPPTIIEGPPAKFQFRSGQDFQLKCSAIGSPKPTYEWRFKGKRLDLNEYDNVIMSNEDGSLIFTQGSEINTGTYQCFAKNEYGKAMSGLSTLTRSFLHPYPPNIPVTAYTGDAGTHITIFCKAPPSVPTARITWSLAMSTVDKSPTELQLDNRINIDEKGDLHFSFLKKTDERSGQLYVCNSYNPELISRVGGSFSSLKVNSRGSVQKKQPELVSSSVETKVGLIGGAISLKCLFSGNPAPQVSWSRVGGTLPASRALWNGQEGTLLEIKNLEQGDEGDYKCQGSNSRGSEEHTMKIDIQSIPMFEGKNKRPHNYNATEGEDVVFICDPKAEPTAEILWFINGVKLNLQRPGAQRLISADRKNLTLYKVCKDCKVNSLMNVQCMAKNKHGSAIADGYLNVLKPTVMTLAPEDVELVYGEKVIFKCEATSDDSTPVNIRWLKDNIEIPYELHRIEVNETDFSLHIRTEDDEDQGASHEGKYTCIADNGYSEVSAAAQLTLPPGPVPSVIPVKSGGGLWWIFVLIAIILLLLIILLCCCLCLQRNRGDEYSVDEKERKNGNDPEKELKDNGFQDYQRPEEEPMKGSRASLSSTIKLGESDDEGSLAEYGDIDTGKFNEDGSFLGQYHNDKKKQAMDSTV